MNLFLVLLAAFYIACCYAVNDLCKVKQAEIVTALRIMSGRANTLEDWRRIKAALVIGGPFSFAWLVYSGLCR